MSPSDRPSRGKDVEAAVRACYRTWSTSYFDDYYGVGAPYPPVHTDLVAAILHEAGAGRVLDAGCGPASMMRSLLERNFEVEGFDLTPEMVQEAQRVVAQFGVAPAKVWHGSVLDADAFGGGGYDAAICIGVLPHVPEDADETVVQNLADSVRAGGTVILEARNELFSLFTLNRYTRAFFMDRLLPLEQLRTAALDDERGALEEALTELSAMLRTDLPPVRTGTDGDPGYDEVLSRLHNPFTLADLMRGVGLADVRVAFYHQHSLPPLVSDRVPELSRRVSVQMESPFDWRGHFTASAFVAFGRKT